ncbi:AAA family ATPase [Flammeovirga aprica]|uniref:AAA family ATPase n=1 Tax=Flammeovirga aprica JL-4 TaxID=694437 RepID=A0A7X9RS33_9BACT|nr:AAA family ATPase [Flammeovirga aprica]NME66556.1 AAA family ATPase [Flammeovirga aprica JL-4]
MSPEKYSLSYLKIENFKAIKKAEVDLSDKASWIFLTGENGFGKTLVLQAIAKGLNNENTRIYLDDFSTSKVGTKITTRINQREEIFVVENSKKGFDALNIDYRLVGFGANRLNMGSERSTKKRNPLMSLFDVEPLLRNIESEGLSRWRFDKRFEERFYQVKDIFKELLPNLHDITISDDSDYTVLYSEKDNEGNVVQEGLSFGELASGYQNIIAMIGDMILNLLDYSKGDKIKHIRDMKGLVLIDEVELYLHPKLQKELPSILSNIFPNVLFIASTHSPIPLLGAPEGSIFLNVQKSLEEGITIERLYTLEEQVASLLPNTILSSPIFGLQDIFSVQHDENKKVRTEPTYDEIIKRDEKKKKLTKKENPELDNMLKSFIKNKK